MGKNSSSMKSGGYKAGAIGKGRGGTTASNSGVSKMSVKASSKKK